MTNDASLTALAESHWDVVIAGAGPAGALLGYLLARRNRRVLIADRSAFPRDKVCGGCLNRRALAALERAGLGDLPRKLGASTLDRLHLSTGRTEVDLPLPSGLALSRRILDAALMQSAVEAGATFVTETHVKTGRVSKGARSITLRQANQQVVVHAPCFIDASGLSGNAWEEDAPVREVHPMSRIGAGVVLERPCSEYASGCVHMAWTPRGYVGLARSEGGRMNVAAALDPAWVKERGGLAKAAAYVLAHVDWPPPEGLEEARWKGSPPLSVRRRPLAAERAFVLGDAGGYVEPFTGEGMAWAMGGALALSPIVDDLLAHGYQSRHAQAWTRTHARSVRRRQRVCAAVARLLRHDATVRLCMRVLHKAPWLVNPILNHINSGPFVSVERNVS